MLALESTFFSALSSQDLTYHYYSCFFMTWSETLSGGVLAQGVRVCMFSLHAGALSSLLHHRAITFSQAAGTRGQSGQRKETRVLLGISLCVKHVWLGRSKVRGSLTWNSQQRAPLRAPPGLQVTADQPPTAAILSAHISFYGLNTHRGCIAGTKNTSLPNGVLNSVLTSVCLN